MDRVTVHTITMTWDPAARLAHIFFTAPTQATGEDARALVAAITAWVGTEGKPFGLLGDGGKLGAISAEYRATWGRFFKEHRGHSHLAFYSMTPIIRLAAEMFRIGTGLDMRAFATEEEARSWLKAKGIGPWRSQRPRNLGL